MSGIFRRTGRTPVEFVAPSAEAPSSQTLVRDALCEIDRLLSTGDRRLRDPLLDVRLKLRPPVPVVPGRST